MIVVPRDVRLSLLQSPYWMSIDKLQFLSVVTKQMLMGYVQQLTGLVFVEGLIQGNITSEVGNKCLLRAKSVLYSVENHVTPTKIWHLFSFYYSNHILLCIFSNRLCLSVLVVVRRYLPKSIQSFGMNLNKVYPHYYHYNTCDSVIRIKRCFYDSDYRLALTRLFSGGFGDGVLPAQTAQV